MDFDKLHIINHNSDTNTNIGNNNSLVTRIWGPPTWKALQCFCFGYPMNPSQIDKDKFMIFFETLSYVLPCESCRVSYGNFIKSGDTKLTPEVFQNTNTLTRWIYNLHQTVNKKLDVEYNMPYEKFVDTFEKFKTSCDKATNDQCQLIVNNDTDKNDNIDLINYKYSIECKIISRELADKFASYAKKRNIIFELDKYINPSDDAWFQRNVKCFELIKSMREKNSPALELQGEYCGLPTVDELILISCLCSTLSNGFLDTISQQFKTDDKKSNVSQNKKYKFMK